MLNFNIIIYKDSFIRYLLLLKVYKFFNFKLILYKIDQRNLYKQQLNMS